MARQKIIFRADGNSEIGLGHVARCLALAELLSEEYYTSFAIQSPDAGLAKTIQEVVNELIPLPISDPAEDSFRNELIQFATEEDTVVLDGYRFDRAYEEHVRTFCRTTVCIDDIPGRHFVSDAIFNFCAAFSASDYSKEFYTRLYLGLEYLFLRAPFLNLAVNPKEHNSRLFLNMGGADPHNETARIMRELISNGYGGEIEVVIGNAYRFKDSLLPLIQKSNNIQLRQNLNAVEMYGSMMSCGVAVVPPSTVALEYLSTGGLIFLHQTADNQQAQKKYLIDSGWAYDYDRFGEPGLHTRFNYSAITQLQKKIFDGSSKKRVIRVFRELMFGARLSVRNALPEDVEQSFVWANDPEARKFSYSSGNISWPTHQQWFAAKLANSNCTYLMAEIEGKKVGQIRFDFSEKEREYLISFTIDSNWRGKGLGYWLLVKGLKKMRTRNQAQTVVGYVQNSNLASMKAFQRAGFEGFVTERYRDSTKFALSFK